MIAGALGIGDVWNLTPEEAEQIRRAHLLLAMYNALQPGVFALSGWDLVGALPLPRRGRELMADGDTLDQPGAYDLMGVNPSAPASAAGLPKAPALYGSLVEQLQQPDSFAVQLKRLLHMRAQYRLYAARQTAVPQTASKGLLVMAHELPDGLGRQATALNFGAQPVNEVVDLGWTPRATTIDMLNGQEDGTVTATGGVPVRLESYSGKSLLLRE